MPNIQVDTKFGSPRINTSWESDHYLLNGEELVKVGIVRALHSRIMGRCPGPTQFRRRAEHGGFERILRNEPVRYRDAPWHHRRVDRDQPGWHDLGVWEHQLRPRRSGRTGSTTARAVFPFTGRWRTSSTGSAIASSITTRTPSITSEETLSLASITYTRSPTKAPSYTIIPEYTPRAPTYSTLSDAHLSKEIRTTNLPLRPARHVRRAHCSATTSSRTSRASSASRCFSRFPSTAATSTEISTRTSSTTTSCRETPSNRVQFGGPIQWATHAPSTAPTLGKSNSTSGNLSGFIGLGPVDCYPHVGAGMSGGANIETEQGGLRRRERRRPSRHPDREQPQLRGQHGLPQWLCRRQSEPGDVHGDVDGLRGPQPLGRVVEDDQPGAALPRRVRRQWLPQHLALRRGSHHRGHERRWSARPLQRRFVLLQSTSPATTCPATAGLPFSTAPTSWNGQAALPTAPDEAPASGGGSTFQTDMMVRWTAPFAGTVQLMAPASRQTTVLPPPAKDQPYADDATVSLYFRDKARRRPHGHLAVELQLCADRHANVQPTAGKHDLQPHFHQRAVPGRCR